MKQESGRADFSGVLTRRSLLNGLWAALGGSILFAVRGTRASSRGAPLLSATGVDPRSFGAKFDGVTDDTLAWQAAINHAADSGSPVRPSQLGTSLIRCRPTPRGTFAHYADVAVYQALDINFSNLTIDLAGSTLKLVGHGSSNAVNYAFGTQKNMRAETLSNIRVGNGTIDFDPTGDASINKRSLYLVGVKGVYVENLTLKSSGRRAGGTITLQNCRTVRVRNLRGLNVTQGMNLSFVDDVVLDTLLFEHFREAIDCDRKVSGLVATNLTFRNGGPTNQCIDLNSVENVRISGIEAQNVGNIALINYKVTTPETFTDWINDEPVRVFSPSKNVTIENVRGHKICFPASRTTRPFSIGDDQSMPEQSAFHSENITLRDVVLTNCPSFIPIELVKNVVIEQFHLKGALNPNIGRGCIDIRSDYPGTATSVVMRDVVIEMAPQATRGIRATAPASLDLSNVTVTGTANPRSVFFDFENLEKANAAIRIEGATARALWGVGGAAFQVGGLGSSYNVVWARGNCAEGAFARRIALNGSAARQVTGSVNAC